MKATGRRLRKVSDKDLTQIEGQRRRTFYTQPHALTAQAIWDDIQQHQRQRVIVICNTVSQAQGLYKDLDELNWNNQITITLLHSRFLPEHRALKEQYLQDSFGKNRKLDRRCHILIATQVIEVGLDITCEIMHVQLCPMNSLLQRAGRCARFQDERGEVYVYRRLKVNDENSQLATADLEIEEEPSKKRQFLPYNDKICELTWQILETHTQSSAINNSITFRTEEDWINQVHRDEDALQAQRRENDRAEFEQFFHQAVFQGDTSTPDNLIRFIDSRSIFVWEETTWIDCDDTPVDPKKLLAFSVPTTTLCSVWREYQNLGYKMDWLFKRIQNPKGKSQTYSQPVTVPITSYNDLVNSFKILVNSKYLRYDDEIGLQIGVNIQGNNFASPNKPQKQLPSEYKYRMDNYVGHLVLMWKCWRKPFKTRIFVNGEVKDIEFVSVRDELLQAGGQFIKTKLFPNVIDAEAETLFEYLVLLAVFIHDLGKLQLKWQKVMRGWQEIAYRTYGGKHPKTHLLAHTDYNPEDPQQRDALKNYLFQQEGSHCTCTQVSVEMNCE
jgi:CRISPR-associated endonuclease/helicase Cas3